MRPPAEITTSFSASVMACVLPSTIGMSSAIEIPGFGKDSIPLPSGPQSFTTVRKDAPPLEVKVYVRDLERQLDAKVSLDDDGVGLRRADSGEGLCRIGDAVRIRTRGRDERRDRWVLEIDTRATTSARAGSASGC